MKQVFAIVAALFALNAFAAEPAKKDAAPVAAAPAKDAKVATKSDKPAAQKDTKAEAPKK